MAAGVATIGVHGSRAARPGGTYLLAGGVAVMAMFLSFHPPVRGVAPYPACAPAAAADSCAVPGLLDPFPSRA